MLIYTQTISGSEAWQRCMIDPRILDRELSDLHEHYIIPHNFCQTCMI